MYSYISLCISEKNGNNDTEDGRAELGLFLEIAVLMKWYSVI